MAVSTIVRAILLVEAVAVLAQPKVSKEKVLDAISALHYDYNDYNDEAICYQMVRRGWADERNCGTEEERYHVREPIEAQFWYWKGDNFDMNRAVTDFYEQKILAEGADHMLIWYVLLYYIDIYSFNMQTQDGKYLLHGQKGTYLLPKRAEIRRTLLDNVECKVVEQFFNGLEGRLGFIPFDFYAASIYALSHLPITSDDLKVDPALKLFELKYYMTNYQVKNLAEIRFTKFMLLRLKDEKVLCEELSGADSQEERSRLQEDLDLQRTLTSMMLRGWLIIRKKALPSDGRVLLKSDVEGNMLPFQITDIQT